MWVDIEHWCSGIEVNPPIEGKVYFENGWGMNAGLRDGGSMWSVVVVK